MNWFQILQLITQLLAVATHFIPQQGVDNLVDVNHIPVDVRDKIKELHEHVNGDNV